MTRSIDRSLILQDCFSDLTRRVGPPRQVCGFSDQTGLCHWQGCDGTKQCDGTTRHNDVAMVGDYNP